MGVPSQCQGTEGRRIHGQHRGTEGPCRSKCLEDEALISHLGHGALSFCSRDELTKEGTSLCDFMKRPS